MRLATRVSLTSRDNMGRGTGESKVGNAGGTVATSATLVTGYGVLSSVGRSVPHTGRGRVTPTSCLGHIRRVSYWPRVLTDAEMQQVTT